MGLITGRPEIAALGVPFGVYLVVALSLVETPDLAVAVRLDAERAVEGEELTGELMISATGPLHQLELLLVQPAGISLIDPPAHLLISLDAGEQRTVALRLVADHWGVYELGELRVRVSDRFGLLAFDARVEPAATVRVYPRPERLRALVRPRETQPFAGEQVARGKGGGIEFADIRAFATGDRPRRINWRVSARGPGLYVNEEHPERNSDVVLFLDSFAEMRAGRPRTLDLAVRAADSLARDYLLRRDRVGLVDFGGITRWLTPAMGTRQLYRLVDALLNSSVALSYVQKGIDVLPPRSLPPQALIIALSPLLDERSVAALLDLRGRGFDLAIIDMSPLSFAPAEQTQLDQLARRLWTLWRETLRLRFEQTGVAVVDWTEDRSLADAVEEVIAFRRYTRHVYG
jgi:uncharacterized protein (DUF58 family)